MRPSSPNRLDVFDCLELRSIVEHRDEDVFQVSASPERSQSGLAAIIARCVLRIDLRHTTSRASDATMPSSVETIPSRSFRPSRGA